MRVIVGGFRLMVCLLPNLAPRFNRRRGFSLVPMLEKDEHRTFKSAARYSFGIPDFEAARVWGDIPSYPNPSPCGGDMGNLLILATGPVWLPK